MILIYKNQSCLSCGRTKTHINAVGLCLECTRQIKLPRDEVLQAVAAGKLTFSEAETILDTMENSKPYNSYNEAGYLIVAVTMVCIATLFLLKYCLGS